MFISPVRGGIVQITGYNIGLHGMFGFADSYSARRFCVHFKESQKSPFQTVFGENESVIL